MHPCFFISLKTYSTSSAVFSERGLESRSTTRRFSRSFPFPDIPGDLLAVARLLADQIEEIILDLKGHTIKKPRRLKRRDRYQASQSPSRQVRTTSRFNSSLHLGVFSRIRACSMHHSEYSCGFRSIDFRNAVHSIHRTARTSSGLITGS